MITESTDKRSEKIYQGSQREQQHTVIASKLTNKKHFNRNCVYQLNYMYDSRGDESCARVATDTWIVWNIHKDTDPRFENDELQLGVMFPVYRNVYHISLKKKIRNNFCNVIANIMKALVFRALIFWESPTRLRITWWKFSIGKFTVLISEMILNLDPNWWRHGQSNRIMSQTVFDNNCLAEAY